MPYTNDATQNFTLDPASRKISLLDGRCLLRVQEKTTIGTCRSSDQPTTWLLHLNGSITSGVDGSCLTQINEKTPYLAVSPCTTHSTVWEFVKSAINHSGVLVTSASQLGTSIDSHCLTAVEPSWIADAALGMQLHIIDRITGERLPPNTFRSQVSLKVVDDTRVRATVQLRADQTISVVTAALTSYDVHGDSFAQEPFKSNRVLSNSVDTATIDAVASLVGSSVERLAGGAFFATHQRIWDSIWNRSAVRITAPPSSGAGTEMDKALEALESNYCGSQYILQIAGRSIGKGYSRSYPALFGPTTVRAIYMRYERLFIINVLGTCSCSGHFPPVITSGGMEI
jgi:hypothetical protein